eukprot:354902-Chlamydomonas_euryale.AAC.1
MSVAATAPITRPHMPSRCRRLAAASVCTLGMPASDAGGQLCDSQWNASLVSGQTGGSEDGVGCGGRRKRGGGSVIAKGVGHVEEVISLRFICTNATTSTTSRCLKTRLATRPPRQATRPPRQATRPPQQATRPPQQATRPPQQATRPPRQATRPALSLSRAKECSSPLCPLSPLPAAADAVVPYLSGSPRAPKKSTISGAVLDSRRRCCTT